LCVLRGNANGKEGKEVFDKELLPYITPVLENEKALCFSAERHKKKWERNPSRKNDPN